MTDRDKLIELLTEPLPFVGSPLGDEFSPKMKMGLIHAGKVADHLISNGLTFQKWIPVSEHEPEIDCLTVDDLGQIVLARRISVITLPTKQKIYLANEKAEEIMACLGDGDTLINCTHITHWMPLPEPPNE